MTELASVGGDRPELVNVLDYDRQALRSFFTSIGEREFRADQVIRWVHRCGVDAFSEMTNIRQPLRAELMRTAVVAAPSVQSQSNSTDGVRKWLFKLADGQCVETVFIPEIKRGTLCVSSQVGCALACSFCATGAAGFSRSLRTSEIIGQLWQARRLLALEKVDGPGITNIVFMGMGEPLLNLEQVLPAVELMRDDHAYGISWKKVTISTVGVVPGINTLCNHTPLALAVSLHAAEDSLRDKLVPVNRTWPLAELIAACARFSRSNRDEPVSFEYTMLSGVNDSFAAATKLVRLLSRLPSKVNLIPCNPFPGSEFRPSSVPTMMDFQEVLMQAGIFATIRRTRGSDVSAACGQLAGNFIAKARRHRQPLATGVAAP
ncbi:MAG: 23S rRNA (adenine(2503)-C(2))-methyltransferase RlmN [Candidatus Porifericomitaceae bacterium WSBS_2022_MAG_OTU9]